MIMILQSYNKVILVVKNMKHATARNISVQWDSGRSCHKLISARKHTHAHTHTHTVNTHVNVTGLTSLPPGLSLTIWYFEQHIAVTTCIFVSSTTHFVSETVAQYSMTSGVYEYAYSNNRSCRWNSVSVRIGGRGEGREAENSYTSSAYVKNEWSCTSTPAYVFTICKEMALNFTFLSVEYGLWVIWVSNMVFGLYESQIWSLDYMSLTYGLWVIWVSNMVFGLYESQMWSLGYMSLKYGLWVIWVSNVVFGLYESQIWSLGYMSLKYGLWVMSLKYGLWVIWVSNMVFGLWVSHMVFGLYESVIWSLGYMSLKCGLWVIWVSNRTPSIFVNCWSCSQWKQ
jgi:hypothetical protein